MTKRHLAILVALSFTILSACTKKAPTEAPKGNETAAAKAATKVVNLGIWSNYISPETLAEFEKAKGIRVQVSNYSSNEELLAKLQAGASGFDVVVPSDYMVFAMVKLNLLKKLDSAKLPNAAGIDPRFLKKPYDPNNEYSYPYDWGTTGIAVNRAVYQGPIKGWKDLFEKPELAGKFSLLDDTRETIGAALKAQGFSLNTKDAAQLAKAKELLLKNRKRVKVFTSETLMPLVNGELAVAHAYASDALQARQKTGGKVEYLIPEEGGTIWIDNLVIPANAPHAEEAYALLNFLMEPATAAKTVQSVMVSPVNKGVLSLLPKDLQDNPQIFPAEAALSKSEMIGDLGDALLAWDRIWTEVKAGE